MTDEKIVRAVALLVRQTQEGKLQWRARPAASDVTMGTDNVIDTVYEATEEGRKLRLYEFRYQTYSDEFDSMFWTSGIALELANENGVGWWRFPNQYVTNDLLDAVRYSTSGASNFIDSLLASGDGSGKDCRE